MRQRITIAILLSTLLWIPAVGAQSDTTTCDDFTYQEEAQDAWDRGEGRPRADYMTGMDEDNDGIACEHLPNRPAIYETIWFWMGVAIIVMITLASFWWIRKVKATDASRDEIVLFPGRTSAEEVEDELALLKVDKAIDEDDA